MQLSPRAKSNMGLQVFLVSLLLVDHIAAGLVEEDDELHPGMKKLRFTPPDLDDEEERSPFLPQAMMCDGCRAVAYQLHKAFENVHQHRKSQEFRLTESEVLDITGTVEDECPLGAF